MDMAVQKYLAELHVERVVASQTFDALAFTVSMAAITETKVEECFLKMPGWKDVAANQIRKLTTTTKNPKTKLDSYQSGCTRTNHQVSRLISPILRR